ncbi:Extracellular calcium-sensing receptor [Collichthys lucidus]|uniref:Extracellular calcium-sensing receptor n=1 Tax=Collichthys lucidus TaxID=240159 RepID=A0A4U5TWT3_COLLU|nr:Extracellular calcium-sensing receptor [Collichthys lucidus]
MGGGGGGGVVDEGQGLHWRNLCKATARLIHVAASFKGNPASSVRNRWGSFRDTLTPSELSHAENIIIHAVQHDAYETELDCLREGRELPKQSPLKKLNPVADESGLLRVGGRISSAPDLPRAEKHPLIIPHTHHIATLLVRFYHEQVVRQGRHITEGAVRAAGYWIVGGKRLVSSLIHKCEICRKLRRRLEEQKMADLPPDRLTPEPPFTHVGLDVFGPWAVMTRRTRGGSADSKRWAVIFTCMSTRAVHFELIESMTTDSFINALRRFFAIRGPAKLLRSDRGTNFGRGCSWIFNPPHSSHMGGAWERLIGVARRILDAMLLQTAHTRLTHEVLSTLMAEVMAIMNARPLVPVSSDPDAPTVLTPAMLLTQKMSTVSAPSGNFQMAELHGKQWKHVQCLANTFWKRWRRDYLSTLQGRRKWTAERPSVQVGDVVLLKDSQAHRNEWPVGLIVNTLPSGDKRIRKAEQQVCKLRGNPENPQIFKDGDIILGGIFSFHSKWKTREDTFMQRPLPLECIRGFQYTQAMLFAIEEINNSTDLLPGISLGYKIYDACVSIARGVRVALALANGNEDVSAPSEAPCTRPAQVQAIMGETSSSPCMAISTVIGPFYIPLISHFATCACLSDKTKYPSFLRTIPSDYYQSRALAHLVKHFGWTWVGAIRTNDGYGNNGMATFTKTAQQLGICLEYSVSVFRTDPPDKIQKIVDIIKASTSKVIVTFLSPTDLYVIIQKLAHYNITGHQWVGTEAWITDFQTAAMDRHHILDGAIGLSIPKAHVSGMREFMLDVKPLNSSSQELFTEFWEALFSCKFKQSLSSAENERECTGHEDVTQVQNSFTDMSLMPIFYNVYKGVYAVAHALHSILSCNKTCDTNVQLDPFTILQNIKKVHFKTKEGDEVYFNENGDPAAKYEIINWQPSENGIVDFVTVGLYDASLPAGKQMILQNKSLIWAQNSQQVPVSVCSEKCPPGTRKVLQKGKPVCCYDCLGCAEGEISNITGVVIFNARQPTENLQIVLFKRYRQTPIVRANNSELSFLLLFSLTLCFLCSLTFIGQPSEWSCMLRHTAFGITFVLCISCVLGKTIVVLMAFRATLPGVTWNNLQMNWGELRDGEECGELE